MCDRGSDAGENNWNELGVELAAAVDAGAAPNATAKIREENIFWAA